MAIFLAFLPALEVQVNSMFKIFFGCKMTEKGPKTLISLQYDTVEKISKRR